MLRSLTVNPFVTLLPADTARVFAKRMRALPRRYVPTFNDIDMELLKKHRWL
jgi:hypothetical protein